MPLFEYCCDKCGVVFEELVFGKTADAPPCPKCGSRETGKLVSRPCRRQVAGTGGAGGGGGCSGCAGGNCASCH